ncbi:hypothetical protein HC931_21520 [Candidatus Gracilibacteria bacterium]|nr:hypothetical protein [Candidatus Gracilibacteria bacterium]NJM87519.1 hypothetical protein [Hydrococcus sp. RU_2_2]
MDICYLLGIFAEFALCRTWRKTELGVIEAALGGATIGLMQTLVLSPWLPQAWLWMLVSAIATGIMGISDFGAIGWYAPRTDAIATRLFYGAMYGAMAGLWMGIWQWLVLRRYIFESWRWIVVSVVSWSIGLSLGWAFGGIGRAINHLFFSEAIGLAIAWSIVSLATGLALTGLVSQTLSYYRKFGQARF